MSLETRTKSLYLLNLKENKPHVNTLLSVINIVIITKTADTVI